MTTTVEINVSDLKDGEMKSFQFADSTKTEDGKETSYKVLISRLGNNYCATSAWCTHYGASLEKGTLTADGRIVCPWHGACFNAHTGDIEDAPALAALHSFKTELHGSNLKVTAEADKTSSKDWGRQPNLPSLYQTTAAHGVVIVGGGGGTIHAIESLRENGYDKPITVISKENYVPIDRPKLSKALVKSELRKEEDLTGKYGVTLKLGHTLTKVDPTNKRVVFTDNQATENELFYDELILAPGGQPRRLPIDGADLSNVYTLRNFQDAQKIRDACVEGQRVVIIGTSFISMELVNAIGKKKLRSLDVIGVEEVPFEAILGKEVGRGLMQANQKNIGDVLRFHMKSGVKKIIASSEDPNKAAKVELSDGQIIEMDVVIMGVGVGPATGFLKDSGFTLERDGGVKVDEFLRVPGFQNVYAIGDIAVFPQAQEPTPRRIEHWNVAGNHGRAVGRTIAGKGEPFAKVPVFWSSLGGQLRYCGIGHGYDDIKVHGSPADLKFVAYYFKGDKVVAVASMQRDPIVTRCSELMRLGKMPSATEIKNGSDVLSIALAQQGPHAG